MGNREEIDPSTRSEGTGQRNGQTSVTPDVALWAPGAISHQCLSLGVGSGGKVGSRSWHQKHSLSLSSTLSLFLTSSLLKVLGTNLVVSNLPPSNLPVPGLHDWLTLLGKEETDVPLPLPHPPASESVRKCQGIHSFFHTCTRAHVNCFEV